MAKLLLATLLILACGTTTTIAEVTGTTPLYVITQNGTPVAGVIKSTTLVNAMEKLSLLPDGEYQIIYDSEIKMTVMNTQTSGAFDLNVPLLSIADADGNIIPNVTKSTTIDEAVEKASALGIGEYTFVRDNPISIKVFAGDTAPVDPPPVDPPPSGNMPPVVDAGQDRTVEGGATVGLFPASYSDPDGEIIGGGWTQSSGESVTIQNPNTGDAYFVAPQAGPAPKVLVFTATVTDNEGASTSDSVTITVNATTPPEPLISALITWGYPSDVENLLGFKIHYGDSESNLYHTTLVSNPLAREYQFTDLTGSDKYFAVSAYGQGDRSPRSDVALLGD